MKQETVAGKILSELLEQGIATKNNEWILYNYLMQAYAAGVDEGRLQYAKRVPVAQYSIEGSLLKVWDSMTVAARYYGITKHGISKVCRGKTRTAAGFRWKYVNIKDPTSAEPTIGSIPKESIQPRPRNRASKISPSQRFPS